MPEKVDIDKKSDVIVKRSWGTVTEIEMYESIKKTAMLAERSGIKKLVIDGREIKKIPNLGTLWFIAYEMGSMLILKKIKFAIIVSGKINDPLELFQIMLSNNGITSKVFQSKDEALKWL